MLTLSVIFFRFIIKRVLCSSEMESIQLIKIHFGGHQLSNL